MRPRPHSYFPLGFWLVSGPCVFLVCMRWGRGVGVVDVGCDVVGWVCVVRAGR